ncbi:MAG: serine protease [Candidatus Omnitrophota bacterium]|nr:serine protease [Candidatus Omnitrophota bacterium]
MVRKVSVVTCVTVALFLSTSISFGSEIEKIVEIGKKSTVFIVANFKRQDGSVIPPQTGTGFLIDTATSPGLLIVTNKHILQRIIDNELKLSNEIKAKVYLSDLEPTFCETQLVAVHESYDLALLQLKLPPALPQDVNLKISPDGKPYYGIKATKFSLEDDILSESEIKEGHDVFFSGYPKGLGIEDAANYPVTRKGMIAQVVPKRGEVIIDSFSSPGNSGSPVYCFDGDKLKLLGIQKGFLRDYMIGYDESGNINSLNSYNSGLSIVITALVIKDFVYDLITTGKYTGEWSKPSNTQN